jgi:excinuclease UvrABC ATPase subunit
VSYFGALTNQEYPLLCGYKKPSMTLIEHNLDVIADADWVLDLGPEGGSAGGEINGEGDPEVIARLDTKTGRVLRGHLS